MKTAALMILLPLLSTIFSDKLDEDNGFDIYLFGSSPGEYKNLTLEVDEGKTKLYSLENNSTKIKDAKLKYIRLTFLKDQLSNISIETSGSSGNHFMNYLKKRYGEPKKVKLGYEWVSKKVKLIYEPYIANDAIIYFYSREFSEEAK